MGSDRPRSAAGSCSDHIKEAEVVIPKLCRALMLSGLLALSFATAAHADEAVHWGYSGAEGPTHWEGTCADGLEQSPIDIADSSTLNAADLEFHYSSTPLEIVNNGHTIQVNEAPGNKVVIDGQDYALLQFHFHNPSEHTLNGDAAPLELHLVHKNAAGELAVVGVFLREGAANAALSPVFDNMPAEAGDPVKVAGAAVDPAALLPADASYWRYNGSLTTPPCSEGVKWHVMKNAIEASADQIAAFKALYTGNARPVQAMNARSFMSAGAADAMKPVALPKTGEQDPLLARLMLLGTAMVLAGLGFRRRLPKLA
jgi:carbonic anhydrase